MCIVEIEGVRGFPTSCTTPAAKGMQVRTRSLELETLRQRTLELMLSGHPNSCLVCPHREACESLRPVATKAGRTTRCGFCSNREECALRTMALATAQAKERDLHLPTLYAAHNLERADPFMDRDYNLCILCARCWRICEKIHGKPAISIINRGKQARVGTAFHKSHVHSGCTFCGSCIDICPTGTLTDRFARWHGKPDTQADSACILCAEGCSLTAYAKAGQLVATAMTAFQPEASLCALGRFGYAQLVNAPTRLLRPAIRENGESFFVDWDSALDAAADGLRKHVSKHDQSLGILVSEAMSREDRYLYHRLAAGLGAKIAVLPTTPVGKELSLPKWLSATEDRRVTGLVMGGCFLDESALSGLKFLVLIDGLSSPVQERADVLLPVSLLSEAEGTFGTTSGQVKGLTRSSRAPGLARPEWEILRDLGRRLGLKSMAFNSLHEITLVIGDDPAPQAFAGRPRHDVRSLPAFYRGHRTADLVPALEAFGLPTTPKARKQETLREGFQLLETRELVPNMHLLRIKAPQVAAYAKPGQFVILMAKETSERTPYTLADWDAGAGSISLIIEEVGRSSRELALLKAGESLAHVSGPLGQALPIAKIGTVVLGGGCYGIGAILPLARALREVGNRVLSVIEASSAYLLFWEEELRAVSDEVYVATKDGSRGVHGGVQEVFQQIVDKQPVDMFIAIGCTFMMRMVAKLTKAWGIPTFVALNPIMVDGTGMCGACRVSIHAQTRFACIDGPFFDAHGVDWDELACRKSAYAREEVEALSQVVDLNALMFPGAA
jgi:NAD(P)H-flavin reductase/ferredoxin